MRDAHLLLLDPAGAHEARSINVSNTAWQHRPEGSSNHPNQEVCRTAPSNGSSNSSNSESSSTAVAAKNICYSDFGCQPGSTCVKAEFQAQGYCAKAVDRNGVPTYPTSDPKSVEMGARASAASHRLPGQLSLQDRVGLASRRMHQALNHPPQTVSCQVGSKKIGKGGQRAPPAPRRLPDLPYAAEAQKPSLALPVVALHRGMFLRALPVSRSGLSDLVYLDPPYRMIGGPPCQGFSKDGWQSVRHSAK